jgi:ketosteroid isomerase-like protein
MAKDIVKLVERYHDALNKFDFEIIEKMFTEDAEYHSSGIGGLYGRSNIVNAMKAYFNEFSDQVSTDDKLEILSANTVRAHWRLAATTKSSGRKVTRRGFENIHFNTKGLITMVEVEDVKP